MTTARRASFWAPALLVLLSACSPSYPKKDLLRVSRDAIKKETSVDTRVNLAGKTLCVYYDDPEAFVGGDMLQIKTDAPAGKDGGTGCREGEDCEDWTLRKFMARMTPSLVNEWILQNPMVTGRVGVRRLHALDEGESGTLTLSAETFGKIDAAKQKDAAWVLFRHRVALSVKVVEDMYLEEYAAASGRGKATLWIERVEVKDETGHVLLAIPRSEWLALKSETPESVMGSDSKLPPWLERFQNVLLMATRIALSTDADVQYVDVAVVNPKLQSYLKYVRRTVDIRKMYFLKISRGDFERRLVFEFDECNKDKTSR